MCIYSMHYYTNVMDIKLEYAVCTPKEPITIFQDVSVMSFYVPLIIL